MQEIQVLIETYWNVKKFCQRQSYLPESVLIETYWNVKSDLPYASEVALLVLIETYWNVKVLSAGGSGAL